LFATSPVSTVHGTLTGNQYTFDLYCVEEISSPEEEIRKDDCRSKSVSFTCCTGDFTGSVAHCERRNIAATDSPKRSFFILFMITGF
jgi:hypothetical protein